MFPTDLLQTATHFLQACRERGLAVGVAESCTGGLLAGLLTEIAGSSDVFERGFVTYSNQAKRDLLGVPGDTLADYGAVSEPVALAMADGVLTYAPVQVSASITGVAGPGGGSQLKPVGHVHIASAREGRPTIHQLNRFGELSRSEIRLKSVIVALELMRRQVEEA